MDSVNNYKRNFSSFYANILVNFHIHIFDMCESVHYVDIIPEPR